MALAPNFQLKSQTGYGKNVQAPRGLSESHTFDPSNTGSVYITILKPGVTLMSDSGLSCQAVPEPGSSGAAVR